MPSSAGDGTIALPSQLDPRVQAAATRMRGYGATHVGILSDPKALEELGRVLEETTGTAKAVKGGVVKRPVTLSAIGFGVSRK